MDSRADLLTRSLSYPSGTAATTTTTTVLATEYCVLDISDGADQHHHPIPNHVTSRGRRCIRVICLATTQTRSFSQVRPRPRQLSEHIANYVINALVLLLTPYISGARPAAALNVLTIATLLTFALAWAGIKSGGRRSRAAHVIKVLAAASAVVMFTTHGWIVLLREYRWFACLLGVFLSVSIFSGLCLSVKGKILAFVAAAAAAAAAHR